MSARDLVGLSMRSGAPTPHGKAEPAIDVRTVRVDMVDPDPEQPRRTFDDEKLAELGDSLRRDGLLYPIRVRTEFTRPGRFVIVDGERRWRASKMAGLETIAVIVSTERSADQKTKVEQVVANLHREDVNAVEEGDSYRVLLDAWGCSQAELARRLSKSNAHVSKMLSVAELDEETRTKIVRGEITYADALRERDRRAAAAQKTAPQPRRRNQAGKRGEVVTPFGTVKLKRGKTLAELVEHLRGMLDQERRDAA